MAEVEITVVFFAKARELTKVSSCTLKVAPSISVENFTKQLLQKYSALEKLGGAFVLALNEEYIESENLQLSQRDEIAVIPPISGG